MQPKTFITAQQTQASLRLTLHEAPGEILPKKSIPEKVNDLVHEIDSSDVFTSEEKINTIKWEKAFVQLRDQHADNHLYAITVCFLGIIVLIPATARYVDNDVVMNRLVSVNKKMRELLADFLSKDTDVESFINKYAELYDVMIETKRKLALINSHVAATERLIHENASTIHRQIIENVNEVRAKLLEMTQGWRLQIDHQNAKLVELTEKVEALNLKCQQHVHELMSVGEHFSQINQEFWNMIEDFTNVLNKASNG